VQHKDVDDIATRAFWPLKSGSEREGQMGGGVWWREMGIPKVNCGWLRGQ